MAAKISPQPLVVGEIDLNIISTDAKEGLKHSYASVIQPKQIQNNLDLFKVNFDHEVPKIVFSMEDVNNFTREEGLHQAVVVKFSYGRPDLSEVRSIFSSFFDVKGHCIIGQLEYRHLLVRFDLFADYVQFISMSTGFLKAKGEDFFFRTFPWSFGFNPRVETSMAVVWISLPGLPPNLFAKRSIMSIASAVGKPLAIDKATQDRSRPSAARVKVILNLLDKHPEKITLQFLDSTSGKSFELQQLIVYDNLPEYCVFCKHQGHKDKSCRIKFQKYKSQEEEDENQSNGKGNIDNSIIDNVVKLQGDARDYLNKKRAGNVDTTHNIAKWKERGNRIYVPVSKNAQQIGTSCIRPSEVNEKESMELVKAAAAEGISDEELINNSETPLLIDISDKTIIPAGQLDKQLISNVALKSTSENDQGDGKLMFLKGEVTVNQERINVETMSLNESVKLSNLNEPLTQSNAALSEGLDALNISKPEVISNLVNADAIKTVNEGITDEELINNSGTPLLFDNCDKTIVPEGQLDKQLISNVALKSTLENDQGDGKLMFLKGEVTAANQERINVETMSLNESVKLSNLNEPLTQSNAALSEGLDALKISKPEVISNLVNADAIKSVIEGITDESFNNNSELLIDISGNSIVPEGQFDNPVISTVLLKSTSKNDQERTTNDVDNRPGRQLGTMKDSRPSRQFEVVSANDVVINSISTADPTETGSHLSQSDDVQQKGYVSNATILRSISPSVHQNVKLYNAEDVAQNYTEVDSKTAIAVIVNSVVNEEPSATDEFFNAKDVASTDNVALQQNVENADPIEPHPANVVDLQIEMSQASDSSAIGKENSSDQVIANPNGVEYEVAAIKGNATSSARDESQLNNQEAEDRNADLHRKEAEERYRQKGKAVVFNKSNSQKKKINFQQRAVQQERGKADGRGMKTQVYPLVYNAEQSVPFGTSKFPAEDNCHPIIINVKEHDEPSSIKNDEERWKANEKQHQYRPTNFFYGRCWENASKIGEVTPAHSGKSGVDKVIEGDLIRRPPMRNAKSKANRLIKKQ